MLAFSTFVYDGYDGGHATVVSRANKNTEERIANTVSTHLAPWIVRSILTGLSCDFSTSETGVLVPSWLPVSRCSCSLILTEYKMMDDRKCLV